MCSPPCAHGGTCMRWNMCLCSSGWTGAGCQTGIKTKIQLICELYLILISWFAEWIAYACTQVFHALFVSDEFWHVFLLVFSEPCVSCLVLTVAAVWAPIPASVPLTTLAPSASSVSIKNKTMQYNKSVSVTFGVFWWSLVFIVRFTSFLSIMFYFLYFMIIVYLGVLIYLVLARSFLSNATQSVFLSAC